jgi:hypothetical protein
MYDTITTDTSTYHLYCYNTGVIGMIVMEILSGGIALPKKHLFYKLTLLAAKVLFCLWNVTPGQTYIAK